MPPTPRRRLDDVDRLAINFAAAHDVPYRVIARIYKTTRPAVCGIVYRWRHGLAKKPRALHLPAFKHIYGTTVDDMTRDRIEALRLTENTSELLREIITAGLDAMEKDLET